MMTLLTLFISNGSIQDVCHFGRIVLEMLGFFSNTRVQGCNGGRIVLENFFASPFNVGIVNSIHGATISTTMGGRGGGGGIFSNT